MKYDLSAKICIVTGSNSGIGKAAAQQLAACGASVILACRNPARGEQAAADILHTTGNPHIRFMQLDLASQKSIRNFADQFKNAYSHLDVLINNAANFDLSLKKPVLTEDGVEIIFATNHLGPFLLTNLLLDRLRTGAQARIINIASKGLLALPFLKIEFDNLNGEKKFSPTHAYYHSKLAQIVFTLDLAERLRNAGVTANCIRVPSVQVDMDRLEVQSKFLQKIYQMKRAAAIPPQKMAETYLYLAADPAVTQVTGKYFDEKNQTVPLPGNATQMETREKLWSISASLTHMTQE